MELYDLIGFIVDPEAPISPMSVGISDQIVDDIHHMIGERVLFEDEIRSVHVAVDTVKFNMLHGDNAFFFGGDDLTSGYTGSVEVILRIGYVVDIKAIDDF